jgi:hypothetical protein
VDARLPPGYEDDGKADPAGDYLVFRQLINEAKRRKLPVVLVTDDEKEDWYRREQGKPLGARPELREEMMIEAGVPFVIMTTETFLRSVKAYLNFDVASETIDQAKNLPGALNDDKRMLAMRRERALMALREIRSHREQTTQEMGLAAARERVIRDVIARGENDDNPTEILRGELEARLADRMMAERQLQYLIEKEGDIRAELAAIEKDADFTDLSNA